ncbi:MAG: MerR family DNA-binding transcriptional regulator [Candidatus Nomurabacteria bacterium]|nr:MerR family DNA-binding transcriptional regulator [Candidatus Nomurabacteria bacterium]
MNKLYINIKEASEMLGVTALTLRNWDKSGKLEARRHPISNYRVYLREDIEKLITKMESGEKPTLRPKKEKKAPESDKPKTYQLKVLHLRD